MDLDQVLYGLDPLVKACEDKVQSFQELYKDSYVRLLNQLAILLREEGNRSHQLILSNLGKLVVAAAYLITNIDKSQDFRELASEFIRVLANVVADNDQNRHAVATKSFITVLGSQLENNFDDDEVNERILILLKNLIIDTEDLEELIASLITENLLVYLGYEEQFMAIDLLADLVTHNKFKNSIKVILLLIRKINEAMDTTYEDDDELSELLINLSIIIEHVTADTNLNFSEFEVSLQTALFQLLTKLDPLLFPNKLKVQRKLYSTMGNISSNLTCINPSTLALPYLTSTTETNGYILSSAMVILGNSITSAATRNEIIDQQPDLITLTLSKYQYLTDPVQFQGILHLLKQLVSPLTINDLFTDTAFRNLDGLIEATIRNSQYYTNFTSLLIKFLQKVIVLLNKSTLAKLLTLDLTPSIQTSNNKDSFHIIILLLTNKIAVYEPDKITKDQISAVFNFNLQQIQLDHLFELTKTIGVLLKFHSNSLITDYTDKLTLVLNTIKNGDQDGMAGKAVRNNGEYIAGLILNYYKENGTSGGELEDLARSFFM